MAAAERLAGELESSGVDVLLDDRRETRGQVRRRRADRDPLPGHRGPQGPCPGVVELTRRRGLVTEEIDLDRRWPRSPAG